MTLQELIAHLQALAAEPGIAELPVYLGDWNEEYAPDQLLWHLEITIQSPAPRYHVPENSRPRRVRLGNGKR